MQQCSRKDVCSKRRDCTHLYFLKKHVTICRLVTAICKSRNGEVGNRMSGMMGMRRIRVGMMGMRGISVRMAEIRVAIRGIGMGMQGVTVGMWKIGVGTWRGIKTKGNAYI